VEKHESYLDYAKNAYGDAFVEDVKALQGVIYVFLPVPVFWSLFDQQVGREVAQVKSGTDVIIFKIVSPKNLAKKLAFLTQNKAKF
jgi:hypothetical protein